MENAVVGSPLWTTFWIITGILFVIFIVAEIAATFLEMHGSSFCGKHKKGKRYRNFKGKKLKKNK